MRYSATATAKYQKAYRWEQIKQATYTGLALAAVTVFIAGSWWFTKNKDHGRTRDLWGIKPQFAVAKITHAVTFTPKRGHPYRKLTLQRIAGRTLTTTVDGLDKLFVIDKQVKVEYRVSHSGNIYIDDMVPLP